MVDPLTLSPAARPPRDGPKQARQGGLRQVLFECRGVRVHSYPAMIYFGLTFGLMVGSAVANVAGLRPARVFIAMVVLAMVGLIGARLLFVASHWALYCREPRRIWRRSEGGSAFMGGFVLAVAVSPPLLGALGLPLGAFWDVAMFAMLVLLIFGRIGCLLHGCCGGRRSDGLLSLYLANHRGIWCRRVPTQLMEAGWGALLLMGASALWHERPFPGALFLSAVIAYGIGRLVLQSLRDEQDRVGNVNLQQAICATLGTLALAALLWLSFALDARL